MTIASQGGTTPPSARPHWIRRVFDVVPDFITAGLCLAVWIAPERFDSSLTTTMMLIMVIEFLVIHATIMVPIMAVFVPDRLGGIYTGLVAGSLFYLAFAVGSSYAMDSWWPTIAFGWLLASRYLLPLIGIGSDENESVRLWVFSTLMWLLLLFTTLLLPIPSLGFHSSLINELKGSASGIWVEEPYRLLAFALLYFISLTIFKIRSHNRPAVVPTHDSSKIPAQESKEN